MKKLSIDDFKNSRHNCRKILRGFTVARSRSGDVPASHFDYKRWCGFYHEGAEPSAEGSVLCLHDEWASRTIPNPGSDRLGEYTKEVEYGTASRSNEKLFVLIHITRPENRAQTTNNRRHDYVPKVVSRKDELQHIAVQVTSHFRTGPSTSVLCKRGTYVSGNYELLLRLIEPYSVGIPSPKGRSRVLER